MPWRSPPSIGALLGEARARKSTINYRRRSPTSRREATLRYPSASPASREVPLRPNLPVFAEESYEQRRYTPSLVASLWRRLHQPLLLR